MRDVSLVLPFLFWSQLRHGLCQAFSERSLGFIPLLYRGSPIAPEQQPHVAFNAGPSIALQNCPLLKAYLGESSNRKAPSWALPMISTAHMAVGGCLPKITFHVGKQPIHSSSAGCLPQVQPTTLLHLMGQEVKSLRRTTHCPCTEKKGTPLVCLTSKPERAARRRRFVSSLAYLASIRNAIIPFAWSRNYFLIN